MLIVSVGYIILKKSKKLIMRIFIMTNKARFVKTAQDYLEENWYFGMKFGANSFSCIEG